MSENKSISKTDKNTFKKIDSNLFGGRFMIVDNNIIGKGSFGTVFLAQDKILNKLIALKIEQFKDSVYNSKLEFEKNILEKLENHEGFPKLYGQGKKEDKNYLAIELLGPNLEELFNYCKRKFTLQTICLIAIQSLNCLEIFHSIGYIHRDIKPENFVIGIEDKSNYIYLIDYGLCRCYYSEIDFINKKKQTKISKDNLVNNINYNNNYKNCLNFNNELSNSLFENLHIQFKDKMSLVGTIRFSSINAHLGIDQTRRDDLESLGYMLLYFISGYLPWTGIEASNKAFKYNKILKRKLLLNVDSILINYPKEISYFYNYIKSLKFSEQPDYFYLKELFFTVLTSLKKINFKSNIDKYNKNYLGLENNEYNDTKSEEDIYCFDWCITSNFNNKENDNYLNRNSYNINASNKDLKAKSSDYLINLNSNIFDNKNTNLNNQKLVSFREASNISIKYDLLQNINKDIIKIDIEKEYKEYDRSYINELYMNEEDYFSEEETISNHNINDNHSFKDKEIFEALNVYYKSNNI